MTDIQIGFLIGWSIAMVMAALFLHFRMGKSLFNRKHFRPESEFDLRWVIVTDDYTIYNLTMRQVDHWHSTNMYDDMEYTVRLQKPNDLDSLT